MIINPCDHPHPVNRQLQPVTLALFAYNQEIYIEEAVVSCLEQTYAPLEIILSDDCSTDGTFACMQRIVSQSRSPHRIRLNRNESNLGLANHINKVIRIAENDIIVVAAGDDICLPNKVEQLVAPLLSDERIVASHSAVQEIDETGLYGCIDPGPNHEYINDPQFIAERLACVVGAAHAFRKSKVFDSFGPINASVVNEDITLAFRESLVGKIAYISKPTTLYRNGIGISTLRYKDVTDLALNIPLNGIRKKIILYEQFQQDLSQIPDAPANLMNLIQQHHSDLRSLEEILSGPWRFKSLLKGIIHGQRRGQKVRTFLKRNTPMALQKVNYYLKGYRSI